MSRSVFEYRSSQQLGLLDGAVDRAGGVSLGVGIRAIKDGKTGYAYTEVLDVDAVESRTNGCKRRRSR